MDLRDAINNTKKIYTTDSTVKLLLDFERVLNELDVFAFSHWLEGELVEGPTVQKYWLSCTFMWPLHMMPDPSGGERLLHYGCKITYQKSKTKIPVKPKSYDDFMPGTRKAKLVEVPIWLVTIRMPQELVNDIESGSLEVAGEELDLEDLDYSYQKGIDDENMKQVEQDFEGGDEFGEF